MTDEPPGPPAVEAPGGPVLGWWLTAAWAADSPGSALVAYRTAHGPRVDTPAERLGPPAPPPPLSAVFRVPPQPFIGCSPTNREPFWIALHDHLPAIRACYGRSLRRDPGLAGRVDLELVVAPRGAFVSTVTITRSTLDDPTLEACIVDQLRWITAYRPPGTDVLHVPLVFHPPEGTGGPIGGRPRIAPAGLAR